MKHLIPLFDNLFLEIQEEKKSSIVLPDGVDRQKTGMGRFFVLAAGPECKNIKIGDEIHTRMKIGTALINGKVVYVTTERSVDFITREGELESGQQGIAV